MGAREKQAHVRQQYGKTVNETFTNEFVRRREKGKMTRWIPSFLLALLTY